MHALCIEPMTERHWERVRTIYLEGIATGNATFQQSVPEWDVWSRSHLEAARVVATREQVVLGWAALSPVSERCVYSGVAEVSIYVAEEARGSGVGRALLSNLVQASEAAGLWTLQAGIFPENTISIRLHAAAGFRDVGLRSRLGWMQGRWRDVLLMERRSCTVGVEQPVST